MGIRRTILILGATVEARRPFKRFTDDRRATGERPALSDGSALLGEEAGAAVFAFRAHEREGLFAFAVVARDLHHTDTIVSQIVLNWTGCVGKARRFRRASRPTES